MSAAFIRDSFIILIILNTLDDEYGKIDAVAQRLQKAGIRRDSPIFALFRITA